MTRTRRFATSCLAAALAVGASAAATSARAQSPSAGSADGSDPANGSDHANASAARPPDAEPRPVPDYDGRGPAPTTAGDVLLWVPRVLLSPLYLVSEYLVRRPLELVLSDVEVEGEGPAAFHFFDFKKGQDFGVVPTGWVELGFRPRLGFYVFFDSLPVESNEARLEGTFGGTDFWSATLTDRVALDARGTWIGLRAHGEERRDYLFAGFGPDTTGELLSRYRARRLEGSLLLEVPGWTASRLHAELGVRDVEFGRGTCCGDPAVHELVSQGALEMLPPGFEGYTVWVQGLSVAFDSRGYRGDDGVRLEARGEQAFDVNAPLARRWVSWGGSAGLFLSVPGGRRIAGVTVTALFVDELGPEPVPFPAQRLVGGDDLMQGFRAGRLHGESALVTSFEYRWPIWLWLEGQMQVAFGNAYGEHLAGLAPESLRGSFAIGVRSIGGSEDHVFELLVGAGTETVDQGFGVDTIRLAIGATPGF